MTKESTKDLPKGNGHSADLVLMLAMSLLAVFSAFTLPDGNLLRIVLGIPLLLFIPGYCAVSALWPEVHAIAQPKGVPDSADCPKITSHGIDSLERIVLSCGFSIMLVVFTGLALNFLWEITLLSISVILLALTLTLAAVALFRRAQLLRGGRHTWSFQSIKYIPFQDRTGTAIIVSLIAVGILLSYLVVTAPESGPYSEFYMLDKNSNLSNLPNNLSVNQTGTLNIGLVNHEGSTVNYTVVAHTQNASQGENLMWLQPLSQTGTTTFSEVTGDKQATEKQFQFRFTEPGKYMIQWVLYIDGEQTDYELHLWVDVA